jgi:hypothetical protein
MISDAMFETVDFIDLMLNEPRVAHLKPTGKLLNSVLKLRDEAQAIQWSLDAHPNAKLPSKANMLKDAKDRREAEFAEVAKRGSWLDEEEKTQPHTVKHYEWQVAQIHKHGIKAVFIAGVQDIDRYLRDRFYDYMYEGALREWIIKVRDGLELLAVLTVQAPDSASGKDTGELLQQIRQLRIKDDAGARAKHAAQAEEKPVAKPRQRQGEWMKA